jgi:hypothetical protein
MSVEQQKLRHKLAHLFEKARKTATSSDPKSKDASASPEAKHSTLHYIADSARLAGFMASVAIAQFLLWREGESAGDFFWKYWRPVYLPIPSFMVWRSGRRWVDFRYTWERV